MELSKEIKQHFREELKDKFCFVDVEIAEPDVVPVIKPSPSKPKTTPSKEDPWIIPYPYPKHYPKPTPKGWKIFE